MNILDKLKTLASKNGTIPYVFGSMAQINKLLDKIHFEKRFPVAVSIQPVDGSIFMGDGIYNPMVRDSAHVLVGYADSIKLDYDAEAVQTKVDTLKAKCKDLLAGINSSGDFEPVTEVAYSVMYDTMDANLVIVLLDFTMTEKDGICV